MQTRTSSQVSNYRRTEIETASPGKLLLMLYDGAIQRLDRARRAIQSGDISGAHDNLVRAQDIVLELMISLDWEVGGEIPARLHSLYDFMYRRLVDANLRKDEHPIEEVLSLLEQLREAWAGAVAQPTAAQAAAAAAKPAPKAPLPDGRPEVRPTVSSLNIRG